MAKVLVIRGANFSANALDQVEFEDAVPCLSISIPTTQTIKYLGDTATLTATVLPSDTTDAVFWESSDSTVVSVRNGVLTSHKAGTVTITATCGEKFATCMVTAQDYIDAKLTWSWYYNRNSAGGKYTPTIAGKGSSTTYGGTFNTVPTPGKGALHALDYNDMLDDGVQVYPVMIPDGVVKVSIAVPNQVIHSAVTWCNSQEFTPWAGTQNVYISIVDWDGTPWSETSVVGDRTVAIPDGADCFYLSLYGRAAEISMSQAICDAVEVRALYE